ncbi:AAA family ATPase [Veronia pacifica]|uniref:Chromosome partitioning protein ParA n=1 Tax=Veronia pacifica TaxID=1080227 RepID=A0A1C3ES68_9GAMM|nr:chromosome partitioning protein ParA [Veronia pacifica]ODA36080.1 chromosome partitioning protein ParA [Veronia pacifica]
MFDLAKSLSTQAETKAEKEKSVDCTLFFQSDECKALVEEVFRFEGWPAPEVQPYSRSLNDMESLESLVILDLNRSQNVVKDAVRFANQLPQRKGVIVIGQEDAISTLRSLKEMGFYYVFWPISKQELSDFIRHVHDNQKQFRGVSQNRKAKSVAVVGAKGGVGTSLISAEIASVLADGGANTILVNHNYRDVGIDVILGLKNFQKQDSQSLSYQINDLDEESASEYLNKVTKHLKLLSLDGEEQPETLRDYSHTLCDLLNRQAHFIIEDYSASIHMPVDTDRLVERNDIVVIVTDLSVNSVRSTARLINQIGDRQQPQTVSTRILVFVNIHRPDSAFPLKVSEVEDFLSRDVDVVLPFDKHFSKLLLEGKRLFKLESGNDRPFFDAARIINGQSSQRRVGAGGRLLSRLSNFSWLTGRAER